MTQGTQSSHVQDLSAAFARLVAIAAPSIVAVKSAHSRSSGFFWRPGLIVTAEEALSEEGDFTVTLPSGESLAARLVGRDHTTDIAVLRVDRSDLPPIPLETQAVPVGALALAVGAEDGAPNAALWVVSHSIGPWWSLRSGEINAGLQQIDDNRSRHCRRVPYTRPESDTGISLANESAFASLLVAGGHRR